MREELIGKEVYVPVCYNIGGHKELFHVKKFTVAFIGLSSFIALHRISESIELRYEDEGHEWFFRVEDAMRDCEKECEDCLNKPKWTEINDGFWELGEEDE